MEKDLVDIFIPVMYYHAHVLPAALCSALTQTYKNIRILLFIDGIHPSLEQVIQKWFYTNSEKRLNYPIFKRAPSKKYLDYDYINYEKCSRGIIIRNIAGPASTAHVGRQWLFEWSGKSSFVKMLDADDILTPRAIEIMMSYFDDNVDAVFCPLLRTSSYCYAAINKGLPIPGGCGSGNMMLRKELMEKAIERGFKWPPKHGHDKTLIKYFVDHEDEINVVTTKENVIYLYLR